MRKLYDIIEGILSSDTEIKVRGEYEVFLADIVQELKRNFEIDMSTYPDSTGNSELPFAKIQNFKGYQYKKALDNFEDRLGIIKDTLKRKGIKTEVKVHSIDNVCGHFVSTFRKYKIVFTKIHKRSIKLDLVITLTFGGKYDPKNLILELKYIDVCSPNTEIKELLK